jgi:hypothetical protein
LRARGSAKPTDLEAHHEAQIPHGLPCPKVQLVLEV